MEEDDGGKLGRVILLPLPFQGHISPMMQLASILHSRGFAISIIHTSTYNPPPHSSNSYPHFSFHPIPDGLSSPPPSSSQSQSHLMHSHHHQHDPADVIKVINTNCLLPLRNCLLQLISSSSHPHRPPVRALITDANWYSAQGVADSLNLPRFVMRTSSICSFLAFAAFPLLRQKARLLNTTSAAEATMEEPIQEFPPLKVKDIPLMETLRNPEDAYEIIIKMVEETKKSSGLIFNTFRDLEEPDLPKLEQQFPIPTFIIGPFHKCFSAASSSILTQDESCLSWLDTRAPKSVLYVSFGSIVGLDVPKLQEVAWGLADSMQPFLWVIRPESVPGSEWLEMLPQGFLEETSKRGLIIKWAPQQQVLRHPSIGGFWTHCGWNSTLESICEGVPMICSAFFGDQLVNARYVNDVWRIGIKLERGLERAEIQTAIKKLMTQGEGEEIRGRSLRLKDKIEHGLTSGGPSSKALDDWVHFMASTAAVSP